MVQHMNDMNSFVEKYLSKFQEVGLTLNGDKDSIVEKLNGYPEDMRNDFDDEGFLDFLLLHISDKDAFYTDFEDVGYEYFLQQLQKIAGDTVTFEDVETDIDPEVEESGEGTCDVTLKCNGKPYTYTAAFNYDWLDPKFMHFINTILEEQGIDKRVIVFGGPNVCMVTLKEPEWPDKIKALFPLEADIV